MTKTTKRKVTGGKSLLCPPVDRLEGGLTVGGLALLGGLDLALGLVWQGLVLGLLGVGAAFCLVRGGAVQGGTR